MLTTQGLPLGVLRAHCAAPTHRAKDDLRPASAIPIEEKKTFAWIEGLRQCNELAPALPDTRQVCVMDREADFIELFDELLRPPSPAVARVCRTPHLYPGDGLRAHEIAPILGFGQPTRLAGPLARPLAQAGRAILLVPHVPRVRFEPLTAIQALTLRFSTHPEPRDRN
jgi:hypothetical protein